LSKSKLSELMKKYPFLKESIFYFSIGGISTLAEIAFYFIMRNMGLDIYTANFVGKSIGLTLSFVLNTNFNFKVKDRIIIRLLEFYAVGYCGLLFSDLILWVGIEKLMWNEIIVKILSVILAGGFQFLVNKFVTFKKTKV